MTNTNSATPRTDKEAEGSDSRRPQFCDEWVRADFARQLETELNKANREIHKQDCLYDSKKKQWLNSVVCVCADFPNVAFYIGQLESERDQLQRENAELKNTIATLETRHAAVMLHTQSVVDDSLKYRILLHEFAIVSMRIRTALVNYEELDFQEDQWLKEVLWLIDAAKEYPLTETELKEWSAKKKTKRWSE